MLNVLELYVSSKNLSSSNRFCSFTGTGGCGEGGGAVRLGHPQGAMVFSDGIIKFSAVCEFCEETAEVSVGKVIVSPILGK